MGCLCARSLAEYGDASARHNLVISKYVAGRPKDYEFNAEVVRLEFVEESKLLARLDATDVASERAAIIRARIRREFESR
jgi:hypothetical protein